MIPANSNEAGSAASHQSFDYVTIVVGDQMFGLPIERVHDVFIATSMTPVPLAPPEIMGLLNLRGRIVTALCVRRRLGMLPREGAGEREAMAVGLEHQGESYGLLVDSVGEVLRLSPDTLEENPAHLDPRWARLSRGVHRLDGKLLIVLDVDGILDFDVQDKVA
jgi:purine-binding chemotaxis protein CheW